MIYSPDIEKICGLCRLAKRSSDGNSCFCTRQSTEVDPSSAACRHFSYDIFKKTVHRKRRLKNNFKPEDFEL